MDRIRRIELLVRAADMGSFAKAARSLDLTPSAVSHAITELEKELRVSMFHRTTRQLRLTEEGEAIYRRGSDILRQLADLDSDVAKAPERLSGTLRVGLPPALGQYIIMPALSVFVRRHPSVRLQFHVQSQPNEMHSEGADVLLRLGEPPDSSLIARRVAESRPAVYGSPAYLKEAGWPGDPEDLKRHRCLLFKPPQLVKPIDEWHFERGREVRAIKLAAHVVTHDRSGLVSAVLAGAGLMHLGSFDPYLISTGRLCRVLPEWTCTGSYNIYAMYRKSPRVPPMLAAFLAFVADAFDMFDPEEMTIVHDPGFGEWAKRLAAGRR